MPCRRSDLQETICQATTHAGLWLDKYLVEQTKESGGDGVGCRSDLILDIGKLEAPRGYFDAIQRLEALARDNPRATLAKAKVEGRLVIGLGAKGVIEAGLHLDHTWGVPILPGSALQGLAAAAAHQLAQDESWRKPDPNARPADSAARTSFEELFGTTDEQGRVCFWDAWWCPAKRTTRLPIHLDVMTVHHPKYYQDEQDPPPPSDTDSPIPVAFTTISGEYLIVLEGEEEWREAALTLLTEGLKELGLGAKTNAGYGRMSLERIKSRSEEEAERSARTWCELEQKVPHLGPGNAADLVPRLCQRAAAQVQSRPGDAARWVALRESIIQKLGRAFLKGKDWASTLLDEAIAATPEEGKSEPASVSSQPSSWRVRIQAAGDEKGKLLELADAAQHEADWPLEELVEIRKRLRKTLKNPKPADKNRLDVFEKYYASRKSGG